MFKVALKTAGGVDRRRRLAAACVTSLAVSLAGLGAGCNSGPDAAADAANEVATADVPMGAPHRRAASHEAYAGSSSCAECHEAEYAAWKDSHHARAQRVLVPELDDEAFDPPHEIHHVSQVSRAEKHDGLYRLLTMGSDGQTQPFEPVGALGVYPLWQYLMPEEGGRLQVTELAWDPTAKEWFNVYEDEDRQHWEWGHWSQRGMNWNSMCAVCHTTAFQKNYDAATDSYASAYVELGVGCEQCHGPMKPHVDWQRQNPDRPGDPTIRRFTREEHFQNCGSCHARRGDLTGTFQVGDPFLDHYDLVLPDHTDTFYPDGQVWDEDFEFGPFMMSSMHLHGVRCNDCHDYHTGKLRLEGNALCLQCHSRPLTNTIAIDPIAHSHHPAGEEGSSCVDCHMPLTTYMARHPRRDHGMTIPDPLLTLEHGIPNACTRCHEDETVEWALEHVEQWYGERMERHSRRRAQVLARLKAGDDSAMSDVPGLLQAERNPTWRAVITKFVGPMLEAPAAGQQDSVRQRVVDLLEDPWPLVQAAAIEALEPMIEAEDDLAQRLRLQLDSPSRLVRYRAAWLLRHTLARGSRAREELLETMRYDRDQPLGAFRWARWLAETERFQDSIPWHEKAIEWDPATAAFRHSLAMVLDALGRPREAIVHARKAAQLEPQEPAHVYALGLLYAAAGRPVESRDALQAAVELAPQYSRYWYNLGLAELSAGDAEAALEALAQAERLQPDAAEYPYAAATILLRVGQPERARAALQRVLRIDPSHRHAAQLLDGSQ